MWILAAISLAGATLNVLKRKEGFLLWGVGNLGWIAINLDKGIEAQAFMFTVYLGLSVWGYRSWNKMRSVKAGGNVPGALEITDATAGGT